MTETSGAKRIPGLEGLCAAILPPESGGPPPAELAWRVAEIVNRYPPITREGFRALAAVVSAAAFASNKGSLAKASPEERERAIERIASIARLAPMTDAIKALVLLVHGSDSASAELLERSNAHPESRPDPILDVTPGTEWPSRTRADVVVIGSGAGGAMVARTLAGAGMDVVIVEEGRRFSVEEFRTRNPIDRFTDLYRDAGATIALGNPNVVLPIGKGVGGTTLVNSGTCIRPPITVQEKWRDLAGLEFCDPEVFAKLCDEVEATLDVAPAPLDVLGKNGKTVLAGAKELGWEAHPITRNAPGCVGSCQCAVGCPQNAKAGVHLSVLPTACKDGARIVTEARVERLIEELGIVTGVRVQRADGSTLEISTERVVIAAGATETPMLLYRSGMASHRHVGRNLALHPACAIAGLLDEEITAWHGVLQSVVVEEFHKRERILIEATATPPGMGSMALPGFGPRLMGHLKRADHVVMLGAMVADEPSGRVVRGPKPFINYNLALSDGERLVRAIGHMGRILFAAGAREVYTGIPGADTVTTPEALDEAVGSANPHRLHLAAFHPTGTVGAGSDPERYPVDAQGRLRGYSGAWVADASILPTCPEVNPQISIMASALAVAAGIAPGQVSS